MTTCPCGCARPVKPGNRYAARGCNARALPAEALQARGRRLNASLTRAQRAQGGRTRRRQKGRRQSAEWLRGYRACYMAVSRYWKAWAARQVANQ